MASSNKSLVFLVVALLMMPLLATSATAGRASGGFQFQQEADGQYCSPVKDVCKEDQCSETCAVLGVAGVGQCKVAGGVPTCCCVPTKPSATVGMPAGGSQFQQEEDDKYCGRVPVCKEDLCSATCAVHGVAGVGQCKDGGGEPTCCCVPTEPSRSGGFRFQQDPADGQYCHPVKVCKEDQCSATCAVLGVAGVGQCKVVGEEPTCCCVPTKPSASNGVKIDNQLPH